MAPSNFLGVVGHTNLDYIFDIPRFPDPQQHASVEVRGEQLFFGGTAGNVCVIAGSLGARVGIASFVGDDFPSDYLQILKDAHVDLTNFRIMPKSRTPCCWILTAMNGDQVSIINQGAMNHTEKYEMPMHMIEDSRMVHLMTGKPDVMTRIAKLAREKGAKVGFDPCQTTYWYTATQLQEVLKHVDHGFFNEAEASSIIKTMGKSHEEDLLEFFKWVVITRHDKGSTIYSRDSAPIQVGICKPSKLVDPTGAGDSYRAGFYFGLERGCDLDMCGKLGATVASFIIEKVGSQTNIPSLDQVRARFKENFNNTLPL